MIVRTNMPAPPPSEPGKTAKTPDTPLARATEKKRFAEHVARADARPLPAARPAGGRPDAGKSLERTDAFGRRLESEHAKPPLQDRAPAGKDRTVDRPASRADEPSWRLPGRQVAEEENDPVVGPAAVPAAERSVSANASVVQATTVEAPDTAQLDRMAAAIAEVKAGGAQARYSVEFPPGMVATGAIVARDAAGALVLRIVGVDAVVAAQMGERLRSDLAQALARRRVKVSRIDLESAHSRSSAAISPRVTAAR